MNERIKKLRKTLDLTQQQFADKLGVKQNTIAKYETNRGNPTTSVIALICREFNVSEEWLRTGYGEMFKSEDESAINRLCEEMRASDLEASIIRAYFKIDPQIRDPFMRRLIQAVQAEVAPALADTRHRSEKPVTEWTEEDIEAEVEDYRRHLLEEKNQTENGSASSDSDTSVTA